MALTPWYGQRGPLAFKTPRALLEKAERRKPCFQGWEGRARPRSPSAPGSLRPLAASSREGLLPARAAHFPSRTLGSGGRPQVPSGAASPEPATHPWLTVVQGQPSLGTRAVIRMCHTGAETATDTSSGPLALSSPPRA